MDVLPTLFLGLVGFGLPLVLVGLLITQRRQFDRARQALYAEQTLRVEQILLLRGQNEPSADPPDFMRAALARAPETFAEARKLEHVRHAIACVICGEPTAIVCPACGNRLCVVHRNACPCTEG